MIVVHTGGTTVEYGDVTRFSTDENNNLCLWTGRDADKLVTLFAAGRWELVEVTADD